MRKEFGLLVMMEELSIVVLISWIYGDPIFSVLTDTKLVMVTKWK